MELSHESKIYKSKFSDAFSNVNLDFMPKWDMLFAKKSFEVFLDEIPKGHLPKNLNFQNEEEKKNFYLGLIILFAECQITFEQALLLTKKVGDESDFDLAIKKFHHEELSHSLGYRHFLNNCKVLDWKENRILIGRNTLIRKVLFWWVKRFPESLYLVGAKSEVFSLCYSKFLKKNAYKADDWVHINKIHFEDEVHHIPFAINLHKEFHQKAPVKTFFTTYTMFLIVQFINFTACYNWVALKHPQKSFFKKILLTLKIGRWIVRDFRPYIETRKVFRHNMKKIKISKVYKAMAL